MYPRRAPDASATRDGSTPQDQARAALSRRVLMVAVMLAAAGTALLVLYLRRFETEASGGERIRLLAVVKSVQRGAVLTEDMLGEREVPVLYVEPRAIRAAELSKVKGLRAGHDLDPQDGLLWTDLAIDVAHRDLSTLVQPGHRALTIEARQTGLIRPGDYVDVITNFVDRVGRTPAGASVVLLQRVVVLAVGEETDRQAFAADQDDKDLLRRRGATLTLSVRLQEAQLLTLAARQGALSVVLRDRTDPSVFDELPNVTVDNLVDQAVRANNRRSARFANRQPTRITAEGRR